MDKTTFAILVTVAFSAIGVLGDLSFVLYASTAFGWVFVMKYLKLATIGVLYSVSMVLLLTAVGTVIFRESLNYSEMAGIVLAIAALVLLIRFA